MKIPLDEDTPFKEEDTLFKEFVDENNPFTNKKTAKIFSKVMRKTYQFAIHCSYLEYPLGDKKEINDQIESLKEEIKEIHNDLKDLIRKEATKKKEHHLLRFLKVQPRLLQHFMNSILYTLEKHLDTRYPRDMTWKKEEDIKRYWEDTYKKPYPKKIYMDSSSKVTIAISILAYQWGCPFRKLYDIYNKANRRRNVWIREYGKALEESRK